MSESPPASTTAELPPVRPVWKRPAVVGGGIAAAVVIVGAGAYAFTLLSGGGPQPHDVLPANTVAYTRVDLDPSAGQKIAVLRLVRKFPELADQLRIKNPDQDVRKLIVEEATKGCDLDYEKDVDPWLGSRVGVGLVPRDDQPDPVVALQVKDEKRARIGIRSLEKCGDVPSSEASGIAFLDGYAILAETQDIADGARKDATKASLADDDDFADAMSELGDEGFASGWVDVKALSKIPEVKQEIPEDVLTQIGENSIAMTLRAESDAVELVVTSDGLPKDAETTPIDIGSLPGTTAAAIGIRVPAKAVRAQWTGFIDGMKTGGFDPSRDITAFESDTGLRLPEDLETLFSGGLTLAVGSRNLDTIVSQQGPPDPSTFDVGLRIGHAKAADLAQRLVTLARNTLGLELSTTKAKGGTIIATNAKAFRTKGADLADSASFEKVVSGGAQQVAYVNLATIVKAVAASNPPPDVADIVDQLKPLGAFGVTFAQDGNVGHGSITLSFRR